MSPPPVSPSVSRYVALDVHRSYLVVGAVDIHQQIVLPPRRFGFESFQLWAVEHLGPTDAVVLEATSNAWFLHDQLVSRVSSVTVANPAAVKLISAARVKTDARDRIKLARRLSADLIPAVWVPPVPVRELRALIAHRKRLIKQRTQARNRLHGVRERSQPGASSRKSVCQGSPCLVALPRSLSLGALTGSARPGSTRCSRSPHRRSRKGTGDLEYE